MRMSQVTTMGFSYANANTAAMHALTARRKTKKKWETDASIDHFEMIKLKATTNCSVQHLIQQMRVVYV